MNTLILAHTTWTLTLTDNEAFEISSVLGGESETFATFAEALDAWVITYSFPVDWAINFESLWHGRVVGLIRSTCLRFYGYEDRKFDLVLYVDGTYGIVFTDYTQEAFTELLRTESLDHADWMYSTLQRAYSFDESEKERLFERHGVSVDELE